jgi:hypothetical protein
MKKSNIILLVVLVLGLTATYFFHEKRNSEEALDLDASSRLLDFSTLGDIQRFTTQKADIVKEGDKYFLRDSRYSVNGGRLEEVFTILSNIKTRSVIPLAEIQNLGRSAYIPDDLMRIGFYFKDETIFFTLGKKLDFDQTFYLEVERLKNNRSDKVLVIAQDASLDEGVYKSEEEMKKSDAKYRRLQAIFFLGESFYRDLRIFKDRYSSEGIDIKEISFATFRNKKFIVSFENTKTIPVAPLGVKYFADNWISFYRTILALNARGIMTTFKPELLKEPLSAVEITDRENKKEEFTLYRKYGSLSGYFLVSTLEKSLFELDQDQARYFLLNIQDFWEKKIPLPGKVFDLELTQEKSPTLKVKIRDLELFRAESLNKLDPDNVNLKKLIDFLKTESNHLSMVEKSDQELIQKVRFSMKIDKTNYNVIYEDSDLIFLDSQRNIMYHYYVGNESPIDLDIKRYWK